MCIAQEILENYCELKKKLMDARRKWLKVNVKQGKDEQYYKELKFKRLTVSSSQAILNRKHQLLLKHSKDIQRISENHEEYFREKKERIKINPSNSLKGFSSHRLQRDTVDLQRNTLFGPVTKKQFQHLIHPTSKIILDKKKGVEKDEDGALYRVPVEVAKEEDKYKIKQSESYKTISKRTFLHCYSTGPRERMTRFVREEIT